MQLGRGHTKGDTVVWLPQEKILFSGDLVEFDATPYTGDAYLTDWPATLDAIAALGPQKLVPGRGAALQTPAQVKAGLDGTRAFVTAMYESVKRGAGAGRDLRSVYKETYAALKPKFGHWVIFDHCLPFDVSRAYDEATGYPASAHLDRAARQGDVAGAGGMNPPCTCRRFIRTSLQASCAPTGSRAYCGCDRRRGPGGSGMRDRSRAARHPTSSSSTTTTRSAPARARSAGRSERWRFSIVWVAATRYAIAASSWKVGKVFFREKLAYQFDLLPEPGHHRPAFVNLQQYLLEEIMVERLRTLGHDGAMEEQGDWCDATSRRSAGRGRNSRRPLCDRSRLRNRSRWSA